MKYQFGLCKWASPDYGGVQNFLETGYLFLLAIDRFLPRLSLLKYSLAYFIFLKVAFIWKLTVTKPIKPPVKVQDKVCLRLLDTTYIRKVPGLFSLRYIYQHVKFTKRKEGGRTPAQLVESLTFKKGLPFRAASAHCMKQTLQRVHWFSLLYVWTRPKFFLSKGQRAFLPTLKS